MKNRNVFKSISIIYGLFITFLLLLILAPKIVGKIVEKGFPSLVEMSTSLLDWNDPGNFFLLYLIGYAILWWNPLWGSIIIISNSIFYIIISGVHGPPIFAVPAFIVGVLYLIHWILTRNRQ